MDIRWKEIGNQLLTHMQYSFVSILVSIIIGISLGSLIYKSKIAKSFFVSSSSILQVVPSIAIFGLLVPFVDSILLIVLVTLISYGIFPILSSTVVALNSIPQSNIDSARSLGLNRLQILIRIKFAAGIPAIINGIRITSVLIIGTASIAFTIAGGGLGQIINEGIIARSASIVMQGAIPVILLALFTTGLLTFINFAFTYKGKR